MTFTRWIPTFLAFPLGGLLAIETVGSSDGPLSAALGGLLAGAVIGAGQWLALRSGGTSPRWIGRTAAGMAAGAALSAVITGSATDVAGLVTSGLVTGAIVGAAQGPLLGRAATPHPLRGRGARTAAWAAATSGAWALGWLVTSQVIVDADRHHHVFGSTGALTATVLTGLALRALTGRPAPRVAGVPAAAPAPRAGA